MQIKHPMQIHMGEVEMIKPLTNQHYIACVIAIGVFIGTADAHHLQDAINYSLQAVLEFKVN